MDAFGDQDTTTTEAVDLQALAEVAFLHLDTGVAPCRVDLDVNDAGKSDAFAP